MSVLRPLLSRRGRLIFVATALLLIGTLLAAPSVSGAKAAVKQFVASISGGGAAGKLTETVTNCGGPTPVPAACTASSTIALGSVRIAVPPDFQPITGEISAASPTPGRNWTASYNTALGTIDAFAITGSDKLQPGESILITFSVLSTTCPTGTTTYTFTTSAWGSTAISGSDPFELKSSQPTVTCLASGELATDRATGQTERINSFTGHLLVTFGGAGPDCSGEAFGAFGDQWEMFHLPTGVGFYPAGDFVSSGLNKVSTSEFPLTTSRGDVSSYLICFAVPQAGHSRFVSLGSGMAVDQQIGFDPYFVGILPPCAAASMFVVPPCVSEQSLTTGPGARRVHIAITVEPGDPHKR